MKLLALGALLVLVVLQGTWLPHMRVAGVMPDAVLVALTSWSLLAGGTAVVPLAAGSGILLDVMAGAPLGLSAAALLLAVLAVGWWRGTVFSTGIGIFVTATIVTTAVYDATFLVGLQSLHDPVNWQTALRTIVAPGALVNGLLALPAGYLCSGLARRLGTLDPTERLRTTG